MSKFSDCVKLLFPDDQKLCLVSNVSADQKEPAWEEADVVPAPEKVAHDKTVDDGQPSPEKDTEDDLIYEAFKKLTPEYLLIISEMRNLLNSDTKKIVFHALATHLSADKVATHLGITPREVKLIFQEALKDIEIQAGFVRGYLNNGIKKDAEIRNLKLKQQLLDAKVARLSSGVSSERKAEAARIPIDKQRLLLKKPLTDSLSLDARVLNVLFSLGIETLEDLLRYSKLRGGLTALKMERNFGQLSLSRLEYELVEKGIMGPNGHCDLYEDL